MAVRTKRITVVVEKKDGTITQEQRDVYARGLWNTQEIKITGAVAGQGVTDFEDGKGVTFSVAQQPNSVGSEAIQGGAVTLEKIADAAKNGTIQDNDNKLATHAQVKTYVDAMITGKGTYLGKMTVAEINALDSSSLRNGDHVATSDAGTITLGGFDVIAGADLILYKDGSTVRWDSMDGNFKTKQEEVDDPDADGTSLEFISNISQNKNGDITVQKKSVDLSNVTATTADKLKPTRILTTNTAATFEILTYKYNTGSNDIPGGGILSFTSRDIANNNIKGQILYSYNKVEVLVEGYSLEKSKQISFNYYRDENGLIHVYCSIPIYSGCSFVLLNENSDVNSILKNDTIDALPEGAVEATVKYNVAVDSAKGSASVPVYVDAYGNVQEATDVATKSDLYSKNSMISLNTFGNRWVRLCSLSPTLRGGTTINIGTYAPWPGSQSSAYKLTFFSGVGFGIDNLIIEGVGQSNYYAVKKFRILKKGNSSIYIDAYVELTAETTDFNFYLGASNELDKLQGLDRITLYDEDVEVTILEGYGAKTYELNNTNDAWIQASLHGNADTATLATTAKKLSEAKGSTSVPVYVDANGNVKECTNDFVHDGDVLQEMDTSSDKPIAAQAVNAAIQNAIGGQATFGGEKTIAELNAIMTAGNVPSGTYYIVGGTSSGRLNNPDGTYIEVDPGNQVTIFNPEGTTQDKWFKNSAGKANDNMLGLVKTNSVDGGVSLDDNCKMKVNGWDSVAKKTDVTQEISNAITTEASNREQAISSLQTTLQNAINAEATARENADAALQANIDAEAAERATAIDDYVMFTEAEAETIFDEVFV